MAQVRRRSARRRRLLTGALSVAGHLLVLLALLSAQSDPPKAPEPEPMTVVLVDTRPPAKPVAPRTPDRRPPAKPAKRPTPPHPAPAKPPPRRHIFRPTPAPPHIVPLPAGKGPTADGTDELSDAQVASAATAGAGPAGGACDMARWLQSALRKDPQVQAAVVEANRGKAIVIWNGDWVRHPGQEGAGLAAVREALLWEIAFAPKPCRAEPVHGLVLFSLADGPGAARIVVGSREWRWSDLLLARSGVSGEASSRR